MRNSLIPASGDFVVLTQQGRAMLHADPAGAIVARTADEVGPALDAIDAALAQGLHVAGYLGFEAGLALEPRLTQLRPAGEDPLLWFGLFRERSELPEGWSAGMGPGGTGAAVPALSRADYAAAFVEAQRLIAAGDIYQINLTFPCHVPVSGHPLAIHAALTGAAGAGHGAVLRIGQRWILSFSPELFFRVEAGRIACRPMKGTARRGATPADDARLSGDLARDPKQRAENLMIVDLLRNDIARLCTAGSVAVPSLFDVETYPTIHQLTSTVTGDLRPGIGAADLLCALFPCGSITGAPKIRAIESITALEATPRGIYTGSIGAFAPDGSAEFNVAIRTLDLREGAAQARYGVGSGIVADSREAEEWDECLAKAAFLDQS